MENKLTVKNIDGLLLVDSREVAEMVGKQHAHLLRDIEHYIQILGKSNFGLSDFFIESKYESGNRNYKCYLLTRKGCDMVANKMTGEKGVLFTATYVIKFEEMEKQLRLINQLSYSYMIEDPIKRAEQWILEQKEKQKLEQELQLAKPKVEVYNKIADASNSKGMHIVSKNVGVGLIKLYEFLRCTKIFFKKGKDNVPYQNYMNSGHFHVIIKANEDEDGNVFTTYTTKVYGKGELLIMDTLNKYGGSEKINKLKVKEIDEYVKNINEELSKPVIA